MVDEDGDLLVDRVVLQELGALVLEVFDHVFVLDAFELESPFDAENEWAELCAVEL